MLENFDWETKVYIKKNSTNAKIPTRGSEYAAGYDLYSTEQAYIPPHSTVKIDTGISVSLPSYIWGGIFARSGLATKQGLRPANCVGVIDPDYRGPVIVALHNDTDEVKQINEGDRIAQFILFPLLSINFIEKDELDETVRGEAGFGSTGTN